MIPIIVYRFRLNFFVNDNFRFYIRLQFFFFLTYSFNTVKVCYEQQSRVREEKINEKTQDLDCIFTIALCTSSICER